MKKSYQFLISIVGGAALNGLSVFIGRACRMTPPGGMNDGWKGIPLPFYSCGVWGEDLNLLVSFVNFLIWSLIVFGILQIVLKIRSRKSTSKTDGLNK